MQGRNPPPNCIHAFSKDGDQIFTNRSYAAEQTRANYLSGDVEEEIRCVSDFKEYNNISVKVEKLISSNFSAFLIYRKFTEMEKKLSGCTYGNYSFVLFKLVFYYIFCVFCSVVASRGPFLSPQTLAEGAGKPESSGNALPATDEEVGWRRQKKWRATKKSPCGAKDC